MLARLRAGDTGPDVERWQLFLRGQGYEIQATDAFDGATIDATKHWQSQHQLGADGIVGQATLAKAATLGFRIVDDSAAPIDDRRSPAWPPCPPGVRRMSNALREQTFGKFDFVPAPTAGNPEAIRVLGGWADEHIVYVPAPQLAHVGIARVRMHKLVAKQFAGLLAAWGQANLLARIDTWDGSYAPRFVRGCAAKGILSPHAWGTAFDVNASRNQMHTRPALVGERGCVRELAAIAPDFGFYWGGWFDDGMHVEAFKVLP